MKTALQPHHAAPAEHPIIFSGRMVRAILDGRKTQTRRLVKVQPKSFPGADLSKAYADKAYGVTPCLQVPCADGTVQRLRNPWGFPAGVETERGMERIPTHLWVRETFCIESNRGIESETSYRPPHDDGRPLQRRSDEDWGNWWEQAHYSATDPLPELEDEEEAKCGWRPSIHMPRWASRLTLEVTDVRAERLQDISEEDAKAEGAEKGPSHRVYPSKHAAIVSTYRAGFEALWDSINGDRDRADWAANPFVWVIAFRVVR